MRSCKILILLVLFGVYTHGSLVQYAEATPHKRTGFMLRGTIGFAGLHGGPFISENGSVCGRTIE